MAKKGEWSEEEVGILKREYPNHASKEIGKEIGRTKSSVRHKASRLGLKTNRASTGRRWTDEEVRFLKKSKKTAKEIAHKLNRSVHSINHKRKKLGLDLHIKKFDSTPTPDFSYVLGVCYGDAHIGKHGTKYVIKLGVTDQGFAKTFKESLENIGLSPFLWDSYKVEASSKPFIEWFGELTLDDVRELLMESHTEKDFIRGFYDSEGNLYNHIENGHKRSRLRMFNTNRDLMCFISELLEEMGFTFRFSKRENDGKKRKPLYILITRNRHEINKFLTEVGTSIPRKSKSCFYDFLQINHEGELYTNDVVEKGELEQMYWEKGMSLPEIADEFGWDWEKVRYWMNRYGVPLREVVRDEKTGRFSAR